jgi:hypothetical protein
MYSHQGVVNLDSMRNFGGKGHFDKGSKTRVDTPHVTEYEFRPKPGDPSKADWQKTTPVRPATNADLDKVEKYLKGGCL